VDAVPPTADRWRWGRPFGPNASGYVILINVALTNHTIQIMVNKLISISHPNNLHDLEYHTFIKKNDLLQIFPSFLLGLITFFPPADMTLFMGSVW